MKVRVVVNDPPFGARLLPTVRNGLPTGVEQAVTPERFFSDTPVGSVSSTNDTGAAIIVLLVFVTVNFCVNSPVVGLWWTGPGAMVTWPDTSAAHAPVGMRTAIR